MDLQVLADHLAGGTDLVDMRLRQDRLRDGVRRVILQPVQLDIRALRHKVGEQR